jgi:quercetin dioxygenase-like cupin family protein
MQQIIRKGSNPAVQGSADFFIGQVRIDAIAQIPEPSRASVGVVTFAPGARSNWHTHPLGQALVVIAGLGWTQCEGGPKKEIRAGDIVVCGCNKRHWHGATDTTSMTHLAITEALDGSNVTWLEPVSEADYTAPIDAD